MKQRARWTFLSNHAHVLIALAKDANLRVRDIAEAVGITERAVAQILTDLQEAHVMSRRRVGRRNVYLVDTSAPLRHAVEQHRTVGDLLRLAEDLPNGRERANAERNRENKRTG